MLGHTLREDNSHCKSNTNGLLKNIKKEDLYISSLDVQIKFLKGFLLLIPEVFQVQQQQRNQNKDIRGIKPHMCNDFWAASLPEDAALKQPPGLYTEIQRDTLLQSAASEVESVLTTVSKDIKFDRICIHLSKQFNPKCCLRSCLHDLIKFVLQTP